MLTSLQVPFDQEIFEKLLIEWMVADDQAFDLVENKEFQRLLQYTHHPTSTISSDKLRIPGRTSVKRRILKLGEDTTEGIRKFFSVHRFSKLYSPSHLLFQELESKVDAWTSSNGYAFLAIVAHYVTNDGKLGMSSPYMPWVN
jgi:hypothetical protein